MNRRDGTVRCLTFTWYIGLGDDLQRDQVIKFPYVRSLDTHYTNEDLIFRDELHESKDKISPRHRSQGDAIKQNCVVTADFRSVDRSTFKRRTDTSGKT